MKKVEPSQFGRYAKNNREDIFKEMFYEELQTDMKRTDDEKNFYKIVCKQIDNFSNKYSTETKVVTAGLCGNLAAFALDSIGDLLGLEALNVAADLMYKASDAAIIGGAGTIYAKAEMENYINNTINNNVNELKDEIEKTNLKLKKEKTTKNKGRIPKPVEF